MKWISSMNRQSVLPILFGISLTTFGLSVAILLYTMLEKVKICILGTKFFYITFSQV